MLTTISLSCLGTLFFHSAILMERTQINSAKAKCQSEIWLLLIIRNFLSQRFNPCHIFRHSPHEDVIVIGAWDFEKGFVWRFTGVVEGLAV